MTARTRDLAVALLVLVAVWLVVLQVGPWGDDSITDVPIYRDYAAQMQAGELPYRDFEVEYPPLATVVFWVAGLGGTEWQTYSAAFGALMLVAAGVCLLLVGGLASAAGLRPGRRRLALGLVALSPLLVGSVVRTHFDLVPTALTMGALLALARNRAALAFALLGAGAMTKVFPAALVPAACAYLWARGRRREALGGLVVFGAVIALVSAPFVAIDPDGYAEAYRFQLDRPTQIESSPASVLLALRAVGATSVTVTGTHTNPDLYKSQGLDSALSAPVAGIFGAMMVVALGLCAMALGHARAKRPQPLDLVLVALATLLAVIALGKVLSPQFVVWLVPLGAVAAAAGRWQAGAAIGVASVLTLAEFPALYPGVVDLQTGPVLLVAARNVALMTALGFVAGDVAWSARRR